MAFSNNPQPKRPPTYFFPATPSWATAQGANAPGANAPGSHAPQQLKGGVDSTTLSVPQRSHRPDSRDRRTRAPTIPVLNENPWVDYEMGIEIFPKRRTFLARHRQNKAELVHVQQLEAGATPEADLTTISRLSHPSFLRLLRCYHHEGSTFLFWEPVELSLAQVIGTKYSIREAELVSIVWPIIQGIRHLRDSNRALASLTYETIFLTDSGSVRIADVERSCEIHAADMNPDTLKLFALSDIIRGLRKQMSPLEPWSPRAEKLPTQLMTARLDDVWRDNLFAQLKGGELKMLVNIVSKISHYDVKFP